MKAVAVDFEEAEEIQSFELEFFCSKFISMAMMKS